MNARKPIGAFLAALLALVGALAIASSPAFAVIQRAYISQLVESPIAQHVSELSAEAVCGVTVDPATQDVYVLEPGNDAVDIFSATGKYESQISGMSVPGGSFSLFQTCSVAVSDVTGEVYVADNNAEVVYVFNALGDYLETIAGAPGQPFGTEGAGGGLNVAVDNSNGISRGDVYISYVKTETPFVYYFNSKNIYQSKFVAGRKFEDESPGGIAVGPTGDIYVAETDPGGIYEFSNAGVQLAHITGTPSGPLGNPAGVAVDSEGNVYVSDRNAGVVDEFDSGGAFVTEVGGTSPDDLFRKLEDVAVNAKGDLYAVEQPGSAELREGLPGLVDELGPNIDVPYVAVGPASNVEDTTASVAGAVNPEGVVVTSCAFEYVTDTVYQAAVAARKLNPYEAGSTVACSPSPVGSSASTELDVNAALHGLAEATVYDYRIIAGNAQGTNYYGGNETFRTKGPPTVVGQSTLDVTQAGASVKAEVNPDGYDTSVYVEYGTQAPGYGSRTAAVDVGSTLADQNATIVLEGLTTATTYHYRVVAENQASREAGKPVDGPDESFETLPPARIEHESVSGVGSSSATLNAEIDDFGFASSYEVEYGTSASYGSLTQTASLPAVDEGVEVHVEVAGLKPGTAYHFRVVVSNTFGSTHGEDAVVRTFVAGEGELPDGRVYEMVSPPTSEGTGHNANVYVPGSAQMLLSGLDAGQFVRPHGISSERPAQAAADGEAVTYVGDPSATGGNGATGPGFGDQYLARRSVGGGWTQVTLSASGFENAYTVFSGELSVGILGAPEHLAEDAPEEAEKPYPEIYARSIAWRSTTGGSLEAALGSFEPLFTAVPEGRTPETFGYVNGDNQFEKSPGFAGGNAGTGVVPAFSHLLFEADATLPSTPVAPNGGASANNLYESVGGQLYLVDVLPDGEIEPNAAFGVVEGKSRSGGVGRDASNVISADGSRVFWSAVKVVQTGRSESELQAQALYVRENATWPQSPIEEGECTVPSDACTVEVDRADAGLGVSGGDGQFVAASNDGSRVFFTDEKRLTSDSSAQAGAPDLYEYDLERPEEERLADLSVPTRPGTHADVQGVLGSSDDGSYVYFVADGVLTNGKNAEEKEPVEGQSNLYVRHEGATTFIVTLADEDGDFTPSIGGFAHVGDWQGDPGYRTAEVAPDGRGVVFMSRLPLTGYDNVLDGFSLTEVFVYGAETGRIACASCNPSGEPPVAPPLLEYAKNIRNIWGSFIPASGNLDDYQPRVISDDGSRVFFDSIEPLVPRDSNGYLDVYEWELDGVGSCKQAQGCVYLLSDGQDPENSYLLDASASGDDVFFVSRAQLTSEDRGGETDVLYDARVDGVKPSAEASCSGTGCQGVPPAPPIFATPASATFAGTGNFPPLAPAPTPTKKKAAKCPKGEKHGKRGKCVKGPRAKTRKAKRSNRKRRAGA